MQIDPKFKRFFKLAWAVIKGFFWPVTIAACIVIYGAFAPWQPPTEFKKLLGTFFAVLFFIMFFSDNTNGSKNKQMIKTRFRL